MRIGILGGTFDPVHLGHIISAVEVKRSLKLDTILFMPVRQSPHKTDAPADDIHRLRMLEHAVVNHSGFDIDTYELAGDGGNYTYDTVQYLNEKYAGDELFFLIGTDQYVNFDKWYKHETLRREIQFVVMKRSDDISAPGEDFITAEQPIIEISASLIRSRIEKGEAYGHLLPVDVYQYIKENGLYET